MLKKEIERIKKEAQAKGIHPLKYYAEKKEYPAGDIILLRRKYIDCRYFFENLYGVFESIPEISRKYGTEYRIFKTDGLGYEIREGWELIKLFYTKEEALKWLKEHIPRRCIYECSGGLRIYNHDYI